MTRPRVLIADDDDAFRFALRKALSRLDYEVEEAVGGEDALRALRRPAPPDACFLDLQMDDTDGLDVLRRRGAVPTPIVVLTGHGSVQAAVDAMRLGAYSFLEKPVDGDVLRPLLQQMLAEQRRQGAASGIDVPPLVGTSDAMDQVRRFVERVAPTDETVAVYGETGTGKEVVARNLHAASLRRDRPFVALNAACVPKDLFESELFGHRKGAFTGATEDRKGLFREASGGTLFLDEIAELPSPVQAKLLRALEARTIRPVGEPREVPVDVRIVAATNRDLWIESQAGHFREDLYFRLQVFPIVIPPLRDRAEDVGLLTTHLLDRIGSSIRHVDASAMEVFQAHHWPGNVRELLNVLRRASLFAEGDTLDGALARKMIAASVFAQTPGRAAPPSAAPPASPGLDRASGSLAEVERAHIQAVLAEEDGNVTRAATVLGIDRRTLQRKMKSYGI